MALTAISNELEADTGGTEPELGWYRWFNPITGRWYAARTTPLADPKSGAMLVSAETYGELMTAVVRSSPTSVRA